MNNKQKLKVLKALMKEEVWSPSLTQISKKTKVPISTIYDFVNKRRTDGTLKISIELVSESEIEFLERVKDE